MKKFKKYLQSKNYTKSTQKTYFEEVQRFLNWYKSDGINTEKKDILKYLGYLKNRGQKNRSRSNTLIGIKHYFNSLIEQNLITKNPTNLLKIRGIKKQMLYKTFTVEELSQLADDYYHNFIRTAEYKNTSERTMKKLKLNRERDYILLTFLVYQGLHTNELFKMTLDDIDLIKATVKIKGSRRTNPRTLMLKVEQIGVLMNYTQNIREQFLEYYKKETNQLFLILPDHTKKVSTNYNNIFSQITIRVKNINQNFTDFKQVRASIITNWIQTKGLRKAQYLAGHRYTSSTENYLPNNLEQLTDEIEKYNPFTF